MIPHKVTPQNIKLPTKIKINYMSMAFLSFWGSLHLFGISCNLKISLPTPQMSSLQLQREPGRGDAGNASGIRGTNFTLWMVGFYSKNGGINKQSWGYLQGWGDNEASDIWMSLIMGYTTKQMTKCWFIGLLLRAFCLWMFQSLMYLPQAALCIVTVSSLWVREIHGIEGQEHQ